MSPRPTLDQIRPSAPADAVTPDGCAVPWFPPGPTRPAEPDPTAQPDPIDELDHLDDLDPTDDVDRFRDGVTGVRSPASPPYFLARPAAAWKGAFDRKPSSTPARRSSPYPDLADLSPRSMEAFCAGFLPGWLGIKVLSMEPDRVVVRTAVRQPLMAPHGYLHGGTVVSIADSACGFGTLVNLPDGARGFTTVELKSNFLGTVDHGHVICEASPWHLGNQTQVWDAVITDEENDRRLAVFRCTQMVLWERRRSLGAD